ncbi:hypothetical protein J5X98_00770 [Leptothermofonsia sichuanensis E412]|uniref:hypothetical protein n=1 Tax=Leptothermofonsia sichuanensis TaxID=2917832 RepID=UPI001CA765C0|nr:hypothetical protein [Leptothermofonsia sichuanensis]QZZ21079.1 hypothetical protein J5X98_00770 [Leptothermofonsia sichuanensis E412]
MASRHKLVESAQPVHLEANLERRHFAQRELRRELVAPAHPVPLEVNLEDRHLAQGVPRHERVVPAHPVPLEAPLEHNHRRQYQPEGVILAHLAAEVMLHVAALLHNRKPDLQPDLLDKHPGEIAARQEAAQVEQVLL